MSRDISGGKQMLKFANTSYRDRVCLFSQNETNSHPKCTVCLSTKLESLLLAVRTSTVATALKKVTTITSNHNLPLSSSR